MKEQHCRRCGHSWTKRIDEPRICPKCKSARWNDPSLSSRFAPEEIRKEILKVLSDGPLFMREINTRLNYAWPVIPFVLVDMEHKDKTIISNMEIYQEPTKHRKGKAANKYALRSMQAATPLLNLRQCESCGKFGVAVEVVDEFYFADVCAFCGHTTNKRLDKELMQQRQAIDKVIVEMKKKHPEDWLKELAKSLRDSTSPTHHS